MSVRTDVVNLMVNVGGDKAKEELNQLRKKAAELNSEMKGLHKNTTEFKEKSKELAQVNDQMASLRKTIGLTALSQKELTTELKRLHALKNVTTPQTKEFNELQKSIEKVSSRLWEVKNGVFGVAAIFKKLKDEIGGFGIGALAALGAQFIMGKISSIIDGAGKLSDQLADLQRVTGMTAKETDKLNSSLKEIDTRTSNGTLREIAIVAAKLGLSGKPLAEFTEQFDKLMVVLGSELGSADEAATTLGKILNVFEGEITGDNISHLGNAIVELANKGVASAPFISDFTQRVAGVAKSSDMSLGATVGLAAGFEELGLRSESSATALQKLLMTIAGDIPAAAKIANMDVAKFNELFAKAPQEALVKYAEGLVKNKASFAEITASFKDAGEEGARVVQTLQVLGQKGDFLREKIDLGNESMKSATGINEDFAIKNENLAATIAKMGKEFDKLMTSSAVTDFLKGAVNGTAELIKGLRALPTFLNENKALIILMAGAIGLYARAKVAKLIIDAKDYIQLSLMYGLEKAQFALFALRYYATRAYTTLVGLMTGQITLATAATRAFNLTTTTLSGVIGIVVTVISLAAAAYYAFADNVKKSGNNLRIWSDLMQEASQNAGKEIAQMKLLFNAVNDVNKPIEQRRSNYEQLQKLYPDILKNMTFEEAIAGRLKTKYDELTQAIMGKYIVQASESQFAKLGEELMKVEQQISTAKTALDLIKAQSNQLGVSPGSNPQEGAQTNKLKKLNQQKAQIEDSFQSLQKFIEGMKEKYNVKVEADVTGGAIPGSPDNEASKKAQAKALKDKENVVQKAEDERKRAYAKFLEDLRKLREQHEQAELSGDALEIAKVHDKYRALYEEAKKYRFDIVELTRLEEEEIENIRKKKRVENHQYVLEANEQEILDAKAKYDESIKAYQDFQKKIEDEDAKALDDLHIKLAADIKAKEDYDKAVAEAREKFMGDFFNSAFNMYAQYDNLVSLIENQQLERELKVTEKKKKAQEDLLKSKRISQGEYNKAIEKLDADAAKKKHALDVKQFERQQKMAYANALMNGAEGITKIWASYAAVPWMAAILTGLSIAAVGLQVSTISKQEPPVAEKGMLITGKRHSEGGELINAEAGEIILSRNTVANNPELTSALLFSSQNKGGANIGFNWSNPSLSAANVLGSSSSSRLSGGNNGASIGNDETNMLLTKLIIEQQVNNSLVAKYPTKLKSEVVLQDVNKANELLTSIKKESGLKQ